MEGSIATFTITGEARPDTLSRVVGLVAQLGLTPLYVSMRRIDDVAFLAIAQDDIDQHRATILSEKMRALVSIGDVKLTFHPSEAESLS